jgi:hypothetical protein
VRDLRAVLGSRVQILAPDGFSDFEALIEKAGRAAERVVVSVPVVPPERLPASGRRFVERFEQAIGGRASPFSVTMAQATEVLLQAIGPMGHAAPSPGTCSELGSPTESSAASRSM